MSHSSQRRGVNRRTGNRELIVLAMIPTAYKEMKGIRGAMKDLGMTMLKYGPNNWISRNFTKTTVPKLGRIQGIIESIGKVSPDSARDLLMMIAGYVSSVITAVYTDREQVTRLIAEIRGPWLERNRKKGYPISIVIAGLPGDVHECCQANALKEHTYLQSIGFYGRAADLPSEDELALITMCGHGLIAANRVRHLTGLVARGEMTPRDAAEDIARPCVCGIVNTARAEDVFKKLAAGARKSPATA